MERNAGYEITQSILFDNGRGFALGETPEAPAPFVTWQFTEEQGKRDYYWGHYHSDGATAEKDFMARAADYQRRYGVREVKRPISEQLKDAQKLAGENRPQPAPKKDAPDHGER